MLRSPNQDGPPVTGGVQIAHNRQQGGERASVEAAMAATPGPIRVFTETGNSTSVGCQGPQGIVLHAECPEVLRQSGFMFNPGPVASGTRGVGPMKLRGAQLQDFVPAFEQAVPGRPGGESHGTAMLAWLAWRRQELSEPRELMFYRANGAPGKNLSQISKGSQPYENGLTEMQRAAEIAATYGKTLLCEDVFVSNGTQDRTQATPQAAFLEGLEQLARDHNADFTAITGQSRPVRTWINQLAGNNSPPRSKGSPIPLAQLEFVRRNALARMVGPRYVFHYDDVVHMTAARGYVWEGEYMAKAVHSELSGKPWKALGEDVDVRREAKAIEITFDRGGLVFDTKTLPAAPDFGFGIHDGDAMIGINAVTIESRKAKDDTVRVAFAREPAGQDVFWSYAFDGPGARLRVAEKCPGAGAWGNLRDSDAAPSRYFAGETLPNWCLILKERLPAAV